MARRFDPDGLPHLPSVEEIASVFKARDQQHAVLDENGEAQAASLMQWAMWLEKNHNQRMIERIDVTRELPGLEPDLYTVSTVFLGLNHQYLPGRKPLWFETMVFGPPFERDSEIFGKKYIARDDIWMERSTTRAEALAMHARGLEWLKAHIAELDQMKQPKYEPTTTTE
jgi:hypothetical protein